jgi:hypothetical protein
MVLSLLEFVEYHHLYAPKDIQEYKLKLLRETKMCDLYAEVYEQLYTKAPSGGLLILVIGMLLNNLFFLKPRVFLLQKKHAEKRSK